MEKKISPRTGKPLQKQLGKGKNNLKIRGKRIALSLLEGKTQEQALLDAGYSPTSARNPSEVLSNPVIQRTFNEILTSSGLSDQYVALRHKELIDATKTICVKHNDDGSLEEISVPDYASRARGIDMYYRLTGRYLERREISGKEGGPISVKVTDLSDEELVAIIVAGR